MCIFVNKAANLLFKTVELGYLMSLHRIENSIEYLYVITFEQVFPSTHILSAAQNGVSTNKAPSCAVLHDSGR